MIQQGDIPLITEFDPNDVKWQMKAIDKILEFDYSLGVQQVLFSGAVGSAKTLLMAHLIVKHCLENPRTTVGIGRLTMPDLKDTLLYVILEHLGEPGEIVDYTHNKQEGEINFSNGTRLLSFSWHDSKWKKFRSYDFSLFAIEELTENDGPEAYQAVLMRLGRSRRTGPKLLLMATNPDDPDHWVYKDIVSKSNKVEDIKLLQRDGSFIIKKGITKHVFYSLTKENIFYYDFLERNLDPLMALRMLGGQWVSLAGKGIYYTYNKANQVPSYKYQVDKRHPIRIAWDFNIGTGKPMSAIAFQWNRYAFHWFKEFVVYSARTYEVLDEIGESGILNHPVHFIIHGDASGDNRDTRNPRSDYDIIEEYLGNYRTPDGNVLNYSFEVPGQNPPLRTRHNLMNAQMKNLKGQNSFLVYTDDCPTFHEGLKLVKLKKGGQYIEDDSKYYQHVTTAGGYGVVACILGENDSEQGTVEL